MRFIPEYTPVRKLTLSFVDAFYNTRFHYGHAQAQIILASFSFSLDEPVPLLIYPRRKTKPCPPRW
jgi:hypothetical protein